MLTNSKNKTNSASSAFSAVKKEIPDRKPAFLSKKRSLCLSNMKKIKLDVGFRCDFHVDGKVIVECKAVNQTTEIDHAQMLNYLKITNLQVGLLINFNVKLLTEGKRRVVSQFEE